MAWFGLVADKVNCPKCNATVKKEASFCGGCGSKLVDVPGPNVAGNRWRPREGEFAARIEIADLKGFFAKQLIVEAGTRAIFLEAGKPMGELGPGAYTLDSLIDRIGRFGAASKATAIVLQAGAYTLPFQVQGMMTRDNLAIDVKMDVAVKVGDGGQFLEALMRGQESLPIHEIKGAIFPVVKDALGQAVAASTIRDLSQNPSLRAQFEQLVQGRLQARFQNQGLLFLGVEGAEFKHEAYDKMRQKVGTWWLQREEKAAEIENQSEALKNYKAERLLDARRYEIDTEVELLKQNLAVDREKGELDVRLRRVEVLDRLGKAVNQENMNKIGNEEEFSRFVHGVDKEKLLRKEEIESLTDAYRARKEDRDGLRAHVLARVSIERQMEIEDLRNATLEANRLRAFDREVEMAKRTDAESARKLEAQLKTERLRIDEERKRRDDEFGDQRKFRLTHEEDARAKAIGDAEAGAKVEVSRARGETDAEKLRWAMIQEKQRAALDAMERVQGMERTQAQFGSDLKQKEIDAEHRRRLDQVQTVHKSEMERLEKLGSLSPEALISVSGATQAALLSDLQKTKALAGATPEQILAMAAGNNPAIAEAFKEKFKAAQEGTISQRERDMYEKLMKESDGARERQAKAEEEHRKEMAESRKEMRGALDRVASMAENIAMAQANALGRQQPVVVTPGQPAYPPAPGVVITGQPGMPYPGQPVPYPGQPMPYPVQPAAYPGPAPVAGPYPAPPAHAAARVLVCSGCKAENPPSERFCSNCGKAL